MNANYLLHLCYMRQAKSFLKSDLNKALEYAIMAKKKAAEGIQVCITSTEHLLRICSMLSRWGNHGTLHQRTLRVELRAD